MITIDFTYDVVTPESAEYGDTSDAGFITPGYWKYSVDDYTREQWKPGTLASFISFARSLGIHDDGSADWFGSVDPAINYQTGEETRYAMHIAGATVSTVNRIARLLD